MHKHLYTCTYIHATQKFPQNIFFSFFQPRKFHEPVSRPALQRDSENLSIGFGFKNIQKILSLPFRKKNMCKCSTRFRSQKSATFQRDLVSDSKIFKIFSRSEKKKHLQNVQSHMMSIDDCASYVEKNILNHMRENYSKMFPPFRIKIHVYIFPQDSVTKSGIFQ